MLVSISLEAQVTFVSSEQEFEDAHDSASSGDSIIWRSGTYSDVFMDINKDDLFIGAETLGATIFNGESRVDIDADDLVFQGFQFVGGDIDDEHVIDIRGSRNLITQINIRAYRSFKYLIVRSESQFVNITYCNFENRLNLDDQNILSILVDENQAGFHKIQFCSFKNFDGGGNDDGIEPIRIGVSTQAEYGSRSVVEYCYFTQCNGDGEIISSKAAQNMYRYNTFEDNPVSELVLRHGDENIVYGNFFINGKGGVRVREGQDHYIYNNYFYDIDDRPINLQNDPADPLDNINIAFNTFISCEEFRLGGDGDYKPTNVTIANNIFTDPIDDHFRDETGTETWIGNIAFGDLGIPTPASGLTLIDPDLEQNTAGFFGLSQNSPAINAAMAGYEFLPEYDGIDNIDFEILFDLLGENRPEEITAKDLGCTEYPHHYMIQPTVTEETTGPSYNTSEIPSSINESITEDTFFLVTPNPVANQLSLKITSESKKNLRIDVLSQEGIKLMSLPERSIFSGENILSENVQFLPSGNYTLRIVLRGDNSEAIKTFKFVKI